MSKEKYIYGKKDAAHHEGKRSEIRRLAETDQQLDDFWREVGDTSLDERLIMDEYNPPKQLLAK